MKEVYTLKQEKFCLDKRPSLLPPPPTASCGQTIIASTVLNADLDCSGYSGTALIIGANGITLDGGGHKLYVADGQIGIYFPTGTSNITIQDLELNSLSSSATGYGIYMYHQNDSITVDNVIIHNRAYGLYVANAASNIFVEDSDLSNNGVGFTGSGSGSWGITGVLEFSGNNVIDNCGTGLSLGNVLNLSVKAPISVRTVQITLSV